jgi:adenylate cyclase class 2
MREIEVKFKVTNMVALEEKLYARGCVLAEPIIQHDVIYSRQGGAEEFAQAKAGDVIIRLRHLVDRTELNLKKQCSSEMDNLEYETRVDDPAAMHQILLTLGWQSVVEVKKVRRQAKLGEYEICVDQVERLGDFVELEKLTSDDADPVVVREELLAELATLGLERQLEETRGYDTQIFQLGNKA